MGDFTIVCVRLESQLRDRSLIIYVLSLATSYIGGSKSQAAASLE
jgi:hypothetical protein